MGPVRLAACAAIPAIFAAPMAHAALPDEIQVYTSDINKQGEFGLELHVNTTPSGRSTPDFPGEIPPAHGWRLTPEFSYGMTPSLEAGLYLPLVFGADNRNRFAGPKIRVKWLALRVDEEGNGAFAGVNFEHAWVSDVLEQATRAMEVRPIVGWRDPDWLVAVNPILEFAFAGPDKGARPDFNPSIKIARRIAEGISVGPEYYMELGKVGRALPYEEQSHSLYIAVDVDRAPWVFNFGIGRGLTNATDRWTVKAIFEIPL
ncbi:MAG TPA: hypothetical protein VLY46_02365 [Usitatibacter sp.]|nr:hypothetical protein [Usitatibacter sp.]